MKILVTGGRGFIGSNFIEYLLSQEISVDRIINIDKQTYAGQGRNLEYMGIVQDSRLSDIQGDICDKNLLEKVFQQEKPEFVFNFAAESHVDRSIASAEDFVMSNVVGAANLIDAARMNNVQRFVQISTDEVYGSIEQGSFSEEGNLDPTSPYAASKAAAELIAFSNYKTHKFSIVITRSANNYGPYQFPEKLLPLFITNLIEGKKVPLMWSEKNPGLNVRDWLHVKDNCRAIWSIAHKGKDGEAYNIPGERERTNIDMTRLLLNEFNYGEEMIEHVEHRKAHDVRYSIDGYKLRREIGFKHKHNKLELEIKKLVRWYRENRDWWVPLKNKLTILAGEKATRIYPTFIIE